MDVKSLCLAILSRGDASGYEIRKELAEGVFSIFCDAGYGSIYPALGRLTEEGLVSVRELEQEKRPDKKIYSIKPAGRMALLDALRQPPLPDKFRSDFMLVMLFADVLSARDIDALVAQRTAELRRKLDESRMRTAGTLSPGERFVYEYGATLYAASIEFLEDKRHELLQAALLGGRKAG